MNTVNGFSKLSKEEKIQWLSQELGEEASDLVKEMPRFWHVDQNIQKRFDEFSENTLTNFNLPFGIAPNFLINGRIYSVPMVIEESSVVAAASLGAKFWLERGGFSSKVISTTKVGQVHFQWQGDSARLEKFFLEVKTELLAALNFISVNMKQRGGGITNLELVNLTGKIENYYQLKLSCETCDAMGANFINSLLEELAQVSKAQL